MSDTAYIIRKETDADVVRRALMKRALNPEETAAAAEALKSLDRLTAASEKAVRAMEFALLYDCKRGEGRLKLLVAIAEAKR